MGVGWERNFYMHLVPPVFIPYSLVSVTLARGSLGCLASDQGACVYGPHGICNNYRDWQATTLEA